MDEVADPEEATEVLASCEMLTDPSGAPALKLSGELDIASVAPIRAAIASVIADRPERLILDLSELSFMDSSGLSVFLATADQVAEVELRQPSDMVRRVIELTGVTSLFTITP